MFKKVCIIYFIIRELVVEEKVYINCSHLMMSCFTFIKTVTDVEAGGKFYAVGRINSSVMN